MLRKRLGTLTLANSSPNPLLALDPPPSSQIAVKEQSTIPNEAGEEAATPAVRKTDPIKDVLPCRH
jgi:hypothetical protein